MMTLTAPDEPLSCFSGVEMMGCVEDRAGYVERACACGRDPDFYSVYLRHKDGTCACIADFDGEEEAEQFYIFMYELILEVK